MNIGCNQQDFNWHDLNCYLIRAMITKICPFDFYHTPQIREYQSQVVVSGYMITGAALNATIYICIYYTCTHIYSDSSNN